LELSFEKNVGAATTSNLCIQKYGKIKKIVENDHYYYALDQEASTPDLLKLYGNLRFSMIWDYTKPDEVDFYRTEGYEDILNNTWFCFTPIDGKPCGTCHPCQAAIKDGMKWRFTKAALARYRRNKVKQPFNKLAKHAKKTYKFARACLRKVKTHLLP
jgi:7-cyano-7-deazaguanine synthase